MGFKLRRAAPARAALTTGVALAVLALGGTGAAAAAPVAHGQFPHLVKPRLHANATQSNNWYGYNQGLLEKGTLFNSITGDWTVPTASQHTKGQDEYSSTWIGIGGGCLDSGCTLTDPTLIQTGTEQDVSTTGAPSYSAWWELVPGPSLTISSVHPSPGDHMHANLHELVPNSELWSITLTDVTKGQSYTTTVPYTSTHGTAEWIQETPLLIGTNAGLASLPNLSTDAFDTGTVNGKPVSLNSSESMQLVDSSGKVIAVPSAPDSDSDGFALCSWTTSCGAPGS